MDMLQVVILGIRVNSTFVVFHQVVANVHEGGIVKSVPESAHLRVTGHEACEPIVRHTNGRKFLTLAAVLEASLAEDSDLAGGHLCVRIRVGNREDLRLMEEHNSDA